MNFRNKILLVLSLILCANLAKAQNDNPLQPFFDPLLINPAFAGQDKITSFHTGNQVVFADSANSYNLFYATYDTYSEKLKGGIAFYFKQGIIGSKNLSTTELGFAYSGRPRKTKNGTMHIGWNGNIVLASKQWSVFLIDQLMVASDDNPNLPGSELLRYAIFKPRVSLLWDNSEITWGLTLGSSLKIDMAASGGSENQIPFNGSFYFSKNREGFRNGLHTLPFVINPEIMVHYSDNYLLGRLNLYTEFTNNSLGLFLQGDVLNEQYAMGGIAGFASENLRLNFAAGAAYSAPTQKIGFTGELSLILKVRPFDYTKINPWQPQ